MQKISGRPGWGNSHEPAAAAGNVTVPLFFPPFHSCEEGGVFPSFERVSRMQSGTVRQPLSEGGKFLLHFHGQKTVFQEPSLHYGSISNGNRPDGKCVGNSPSCQTDLGTPVKTALVYISCLTSPKPVATWSLRHKINSAVPVSLQHGWKYFFFYKFSFESNWNLCLQMLLLIKFFPCLPYSRMRNTNLPSSQIMPASVQPNDFPRNTSQKHLNISFLSISSKLKEMALPYLRA